MSGSPEYLGGLNPQQSEAVLYCDGPELVIAGAGSGKTRVLTHKIVHLLNTGTPPYRIMALTFTNKAADEMRERVNLLVGGKTAARLCMGTFHSVFARILRSNAEYIGYNTSFTIYDTADSRSLIKSIIKENGLDEKVYKPAMVQSVISYVKNRLVSPEMYEANPALMEYDRRCNRPMIYMIYYAYRARCRASGAMDFDDLLFYTNELFSSHPDLLSHYQELFQYILVDEYQDTNYAQHRIVGYLAGRYRKLCVVGDDAQSIYSFRGANIGNILNLKKEYPELKVFRLERNYRSTKMIVNAANSLIVKNKTQIPKNVFSENETGQRIEVSECYSDLDEAYMVVNRIRELHRLTADDYSQFAILFRTNAQSRPLEEQLRKYNIPYIIYKGQSFYQRKEIKDTVAYFRMAVNPNDDEALKRVINFPARGIGEVTLSKIQKAAVDGNVSMWEVINDPLSYPLTVNSGTWKKISGFVDIIRQFIELEQNQEMNAADLASHIVHTTGLVRMLISDNTPENVSRRENIEELVNGVREFVDNQNEEAGVDVSLTAYLQQIALASDQDESDENGDAVKLMTVHSAKGLEFRNVLIVGVEDNLFPSAMSKGSINEIEEERRLLYVAITRAGKYCMMSYVRNRFRNGMSEPMVPSPFLKDIDPRYLKVVSGEDFTVKADVPHAAAKVEAGSRRVIFPGSSQSRNQTSPSERQESDFTLHSSAELSTGQKIEHSRFGLGVITSVDSSGTDCKISVQFKNADTKILLLKFARFKIIE